MLATHIVTAVVSSFLASLVEAVEALTIVLAVGTVRGWRPALLGATGGGVVLLVLVLALGPALHLVPLQWLQLAIGILLLLFGMRWLRKAILRAAGAIALHDESAAFARETQALQPAGHGQDWDAVAIITSFKAVMIEGLEVVFIVISLGATGELLVPAAAGAIAACLAVVLLGIAVHQPLARVPENTLKFAVGVMLSAFGVFWIGEGSGLAWPGDDVSIVALAVCFLAAAALCVPWTRRRLIVRSAGP